MVDDVDQENGAQDGKQRCDQHTGLQTNLLGGDAEGQTQLGGGFAD